MIYPIRLGRQKSQRCSSARRWFWIPACAISLLASCSTKHERQEISTKLLLPSAKAVSLKAGRYSIWLFYRWKSKGVDVSMEALPEISIRDGAGNKLDLPVAPRELDAISQLGQDPDHRGVMWSALNLDLPDRMTVSESANIPCVVIFAPNNENSMDPTSDDLPFGDNTDAGFVN